MGFYAFVCGYFYLSFENETHVIYELWKWYLCVYVYGFVLVDLFDEWVCSFYNGGYLSGEDLWVLAFNVE